MQLSYKSIDVNKMPPAIVGEASPMGHLLLLHLLLPPLLLFLSTRSATCLVVLPPGSMIFKLISTGFE